MNILVTSAGRRNELLGFLAAAGGHRVLVTDIDENATAFEAADRGFVSPSIHDPAYPDYLLELCRRESVRLVLSLHDLELPVLARLAPALAGIGTVALVSSPAVIDLCWDKRETARFLTEHGLLSPALHDESDCLANRVEWPVMVKPRFGTASLGVDRAMDAEDFDLVWRYQRRRLAGSMLADIDGGTQLLAQQHIAGTEYAVDLINDLDGRYHGCVIKRKLSIRGDADRVVTERNPRIESWCRRLGGALGHVGNADLDLIVDERGIWCVDINPRFGGAYPFSHLSGVDLPAMIVAWLEGRRAPPVHYEIGVVTARTEHYLRLRTASAERSGAEGLDGAETWTRYGAA